MIHGLQQVNTKFKINRLLIALLLIPIGLRKHCRVFGDSMIPTLYEGDLLIYKPFDHKFSQLKIGDLIILSLPNEEDILIVKRIFSIKPNLIEVRGDNESDSIDSREFGPINYKQIQGIVQHIVPQKNRFSSS